MGIDKIRLFTGGNLSIGRAGRATVTRTIDPGGSITVLDADAFSNLRVIPGRAGTSDVTVRGMEEQVQRKGLAAQLEHYARFGGTVKIRGRKYTLIEAIGDRLTVKAGDGSFRRFDLDDISLQLGAVEPAYVANPTPGIKVLLGNTGGADELHLRADLDAASGEVLHQIVLSDASDQKKIKAELATLVAVSNNTHVELTDMSLSLRLNEPEADAARAAPAFEMGSIDELRRIAPVRETAAAGVLTMPIAARVTLRPGETRTLNIAAAIAGAPNEEIGFVGVMLRQDLTLSFQVSPGRLGSEASSKGNPSARFTMSGTPAQQPAGRYEIYEGDDLAGSLFKGDYTEKETEVSIPGATMKAIEARWTVRTVAVAEGQWARSIDTTGMPHLRGHERQERVNTFSMSGAIELASKSDFEREIDCAIGVGSFDQGISGIAASVNGAPIAARYNKEKGTLILPGVAVGAGGASRATFSFDGKRTEIRDVEVGADSDAPA